MAKTFSPNTLANNVKAYAGSVALDGTNPTPVTLPFDTVLSVNVSLLDATAPGVGTSVLSYSVTGRTLNIYAWKPTTNLDTTLIASTGTETVSYTVFGY